MSNGNARKSGWWYPYIFLGMFLVVVGVNATLAYFATSTFNGLQTEGAYEKGLAYNQTLKAARAQEALGWTAVTEYDPAAIKGGGGFAVTFTDRDGRPLNGLDITVTFARPTQAGHDVTVALRNPGDGRYLGEVALPFPGLWDVELVALRGQDRFQHDERVDLR